MEVLFLIVFEMEDGTLLPFPLGRKSNTTAKRGFFGGSGDFPLQFVLASLW
jgi:hypothetical protein